MRPPTEAAPFAPYQKLFLRAARVSLVPRGIVVIARPPILMVVPRAADAAGILGTAVRVATPYRAASVSRIADHPVAAGRAPSQSS